MVSRCCRRADFEVKCYVHSIRNTELRFQPGVREPMKVKLHFESHSDEHIGHNATLLFSEHHQPSIPLPSRLRFYPAMALTFTECSQNRNKDF